MKLLQYWQQNAVSLLPLNEQSWEYWSHTILYKQTKMPWTLGGSGPSPNTRLLGPSKVRNPNAYRHLDLFSHPFRRVHSQGQQTDICIWPSRCHSVSLASVKSRLVLAFWYPLTQVVPEKRPLNVHVLIQHLLPSCDINNFIITLKPVVH